MRRFIWLRQNVTYKWQRLSFADASDSVKCTRTLDVSNRCEKLTLEALISTSYPSTIISLIGVTISDIKPKGSLKLTQISAVAVCSSFIRMQSDQRASACGCPFAERGIINGIS